MKLLRRFVSGLLLSGLFCGPLYAEDTLYHENCILAFPAGSAAETFGPDDGARVERVLTEFGTDYNGFLQKIRRSLAKKGYLLFNTSESQPIEGRKYIKLQYRFQFHFLNDDGMKFTFSSELLRIEHEYNKFTLELLRASRQHKSSSHLHNLIKPNYKAVVKETLKDLPNCKVED